MTVGEFAVTKIGLLTLALICFALATICGLEHVLMWGLIFLGVGIVPLGLFARKMDADSNHAKRVKTMLEQAPPPGPPPMYSEGNHILKLPRKRYD